MLPVLLPVSTFEHFYRGGERIRALRGGPPRGERTPEEWVGSVTTRFGAAPLGLSALPDGTLLRDAIAADPLGWLGEQHVAQFGTETGVLVKLIDAGQRLPVHVHPTREFARQHLSSPYGKTEAWVVLDAEPGATVRLGWREPIEPDRLDRLVADQDVAALLANTHELPVWAGDTVLVPAGLPHAIGAGLLVLEVQEPTDFSILLEWAGFAINGAREGHLGLGFATALRAVAGPVSPAEVETLHRRGVLAAAADDRLIDLLPAAAQPFFRAELAAPSSVLPLPQGFAVLVCLEGAGSLRHPDSDAPVLSVSRGDAVALPYAAGPLTLTGEVRAVLCRPPAALIMQDWGS